MNSLKNNKKVKEAQKWIQKQADKHAHVFQEKVTKNEFLQLGILSGILMLGLMALYGLSSFLSADEKGLDYIIAQIIHTFVSLFMAWVIMRFFRIVLVQYYSTKNNKTIPRYIITLFNWFIVIATVIFITVSIFGQSAWSLVTAGGIVGAGLAFSLQGIVLDMVSGLILDVERTYRKGDWIHLDDHTRGQVMRTTWRHIEILTEHHSLIVIPNRMLTSGKFENLSACDKVYAELIELSVDHTVQIQRAERILMDALLGIKEVVDTDLYGVFAKKVNEGGVVFQVRFGIQGYGNIRPIRHKVIQTLITHMHNSGIKISETIGEYALSKAQPFEYNADRPLEEILKEIPLFKDLTDKECFKLAKEADKISINTGDDLIVEGDGTDSLMVIAEGAVDIVVPFKKGKTVSNQVVASLGSPNMVGDRALLLGEKRSATVRAKTPVLAYEITKEDFEPILKARPELIESISEIMVARDMANSQKLKTVAAQNKKKQSLKEDLMEGIKKFFAL